MAARLSWRRDVVGMAEPMALLTLNRAVWPVGSDPGLTPTSARQAPGRLPSRAQASSASKALPTWPGVKLQWPSASTNRATKRSDVPASAAGTSYAVTSVPGTRASDVVWIVSIGSEMRPVGVAYCRNQSRARGSAA